MRNRITAAIGIILMVGVVAARAETLQPLDLKAVARVTVQKNPILSSAAASVVQSEAALRRTQGMLKPSVTATSSYGYITRPTMFGATPVIETNTVINRIELIQPIYTGGRLQNSVKAADNAVRAASEVQAATRSQLVANSAVAYFRALQAKAGIEVAESSVKSLESSYDVAGKLFTEGVVTKSDVLRAEVALTTARAQLVSARNDYETSLAALKTAMGLPQSESIELAPTADDSILSGAEELPEAERAEVVAAGFALRSATDQMRSAEGERKPTVGVAVDFQNEPVGSQFPRRSNTATFGVLAKFNVFDGGQTKADIDSARASVEKARADLDSAVQSTEFQLKAARLAVASARARVDMLSTQVKSAEESARVMNAGYREGINVITDVLSVESMLTEAKVAKLAADYDLKIAEIDLLIALGQARILTD